jgi:hypothetical protein
MNYAMQIWGFVNEIMKRDLEQMHVTCEMCPSAKLPPEFSGVADSLAGVLQLKDMISPKGVATNTCEESGEKATARGGRSL